MTTAHGERVIPALTLGWRLKMARAMTGLSTRDFAERIGVSHGTITNAEGDKREVRPITVKMWAIATGVDLHWLETGVEPIQTPGPGVGEPDPDALKKLTREKKTRTRHAVGGSTREYLSAA